MNQKQRNKEADLELLRQFVALILKFLFVCFVVVYIAFGVIWVFKSF